MDELRDTPDTPYRDVRPKPPTHRAKHHWDLRNNQGNVYIVISDDAARALETLAPNQDKTARNN